MTTEYSGVRKCFGPSKYARHSVKKVFVETPISKGNKTFESFNGSKAHPHLRIYRGTGCC
jgi:hypothetical protein